jgi:hypothetical protein
METGRMMAKPYVLTGTLRDDQTVALDEPLPLKSGRVRLILESLPPEPRKPYREVLAEIRRRQGERGHRPRTREEIDGSLNAERESWGQ